CDGELIRALSLSTMRQIDLLEFLKLPPTKVMARWLAKVESSSLSSEWGSEVGMLLLKEHQRPKPVIGHLDSINCGVVSLLGDEALRVACAQSLLEEVAASPREKYRPFVAPMLQTVIEIQGDLLISDKVTTFRSIEQVRQVHDDLLSRYQRRLEQLKNAVGGEFPAPPFMGVDGAIEPLTTAKELVLEGEEQENCVGTYAKRVRSGEIFIYRVLRPQRATLSIKKVGSRWEISELEIKYNCPVNDETEDYVRLWLEKVQKNFWA
ncbi:MAG: PcfJ domain-containing protein, partial [Verrucomicrobiota bacterium]